MAASPPLDVLARSLAVHARRFIAARPTLAVFGHFLHQLPYLRVADRPHPRIVGQTIGVATFLSGRAGQMGRRGQYVRDEEDLERAGGVTADDRVEVQPWLAAEGRFSFVSSDPRAIDLACFASLKR
jgi:hypothetical protein